MSDGRAFAAFAAEWRERVEAVLEAVLPPATEPPARLHAAMRHAMFPGGKRLRPLLVLLGAEATGGSAERALRPAAGLELLHTYSLVHDDLPCMDDDDLRRGRPTCHVAFDEATAVLAGDALLTLAFELVADAGSEAVAVLARAAGSAGMVGGQAGDLAAEGRGSAVTLEELAWIHDRKTAELIAASLVVGCLAGGGDASLRRELHGFGLLVGRAFQIADDCLDVRGTAEALGKRPGADAAHQKATYPALLGLEPSLAEARRLAEAAAAAAPALARASEPAALDSRIRLLQDVAFAAVERSA